MLEIIAPMLPCLTSNAPIHVVIYIHSLCASSYPIYGVVFSVASSQVRGKVLGVVGYGHVGSQLSILAEGLGMQVIFYDIIPKVRGRRREIVNEVERHLFGVL